MESGTHKAFPKAPIKPGGQGLYGFHKKIGLSGCHGTMALRFSGHDPCLKIFFKNTPGPGSKTLSVCVENDPVYDIGPRTQNEMIRNQKIPSSTFRQVPAGNEVSVTNEELAVRTRASMSEQKKAVILLTVESMMPKVEEEETQGHSHVQMAHTRPVTDLVVYKGKTVEAILAGMSTSIKVAIEISNKSKYTLHKQSLLAEMYNSKVTEGMFDKNGAGDSDAVVEDKRELNVKVTANMQNSAESIVRVELTDIPRAKQSIVKSSPAMSE
ncbi:uncharacterized protein LOC116956647 isoform X2 [Petromyzon marinus]|uniref:uncharacterized protein LOC116956647 isoform X2 n=1 Tax=Petromyzon marinus TaxID=7757 RepID=UPI003F719A91